MEILNRKARFNYFIIEEIECGIELFGSEVKSIRNGNCNIKDSYGVIRNNEVYLINMFIKNYKEASIFNKEETRKRKLLLHKKEIIKLKEKIENKDYSCIISIEEIFKHNNRIDLNTQDYSKYVNGVKLDIENCKITKFDVTRRNVKEETQKNNLTDEAYRIYLNNKFIGLGIISENKLKRDLIIQD